MTRVIWYWLTAMLSKVGVDHRHGDPLGGCERCDRSLRWVNRRRPR